MPSEAVFFLIFSGTVLITRFFLFLKPVASPTVNGFRMHHWMYGAIGVLFAFLFNSMVVFAIGLGLFLDELTYLVIGGKTHEDNYSVTSLVGTLLLVGIVFLVRGHLAGLFIN